MTDPRTEVVVGGQTPVGTPAPGPRPLQRQDTVPGSTGGPNGPEGLARQPESLEKSLRDVVDHGLEGVLAGRLPTACAQLLQGCVVAEQGRDGRAVLLRRRRLPQAHAV